MNPMTHQLNAEEFGQRYAGEHVELLDGKVEDVPMPGTEHGTICIKVAIRLGGFIEQHALGVVASHDTFVRVGRDPDRVRGADLAFWSRARHPSGVVPLGLLDIPPDLVVEVRSPTDRWKQVIAKVNEYLGVGVAGVVVLDPATGTISVFRPDAMPQTFANGDTFTLPDVLPGFAVPVSAFFA